MLKAEPCSLSPRQAEIAQLMVSGKSTRDIASALTLSPRTVETHIAAIYNKYGVSSRAELLVAVLGPAAEARATALATETDAATTNLPVRRGQLLGRAGDIETVIRMVRANRLVTLTGAGGIGKTQAALAIGEALLGECSNGVWFVELAELAHASPVAEAFARALGVAPAKARPSIDSLIAYLQQKSLVLVVDNCEHVIGEIAKLADALLRSCPRLRILATSREPLRIADEQTYRLPSLAVPAREDVARLRATGGPECAAIDLFTQRARAVDFRFELDDVTAPIVADICVKLDGIPLAIELAAARVKILPLATLAAKIDCHLEILAGGDRLALPRHKTMHALIDWSYHLLSSAEQRLFACLSVFSAGCAFEQVVAVYGAEGDEFMVLDLLSSLVDKSLLLADVESNEPRYTLLQTFKHYASEKLESRGESAAVRQRHAEVYAVYAERLEDEHDLAMTAAWYARMERESENLLSALDWTLEGQHDVALGQRLAAAMRPVWTLVGGGERWLRIARDLADERTPPLLAARIEHAAAWAASFVGDNKAALAMSSRLVTVFAELGEPLRAANAQGLAAFSLLLLGRPTEAEPLIASALEVVRFHGRASLTAFLLRGSALLCSLRGDVDQSRAKLVEALAICERIGADRLATITSGQLAELEFQAGNVELAFELAAKSLNVQRAQRSRHITQALANITAYSVALDRWDRARRYAREALDLAHEAQDAMCLTAVFQHLVAVAVLGANNAPPGESASGSAAEPATTPARRAASVASASGLEGAAQLLGYVDASAARLGFVREYTEQQEYDRLLASLTARVPADDFGRLMARGASLTPEVAIELARSM